MNKTFSLKYVYSGTKLKDLPISQTPEFVLVGRSNVGKSSLINFLAGQKRLAYVSQTPGRTQAIHIFSETNEKFFIADLPGYGFAKSSREVQRQWASNIQEYFEKRKNIVSVLFLMDVRRDLTQEDHQLLNWFRALNLHFVIVQTKCDKVSKSELSRRRQKLSQTLSIASDEILSISVYKKIGLQSLCNQFTKQAKISS